MIVAENLSKIYSSRRAIDSVSFQIDAGEIVGLLGLNGAGKSTVLKILGCFLMPSGGRAAVGGFSVDDAPEEIRKIIGYLPDTPPLYDEMTVESYLRYVAKLKDVPTSEVTTRVGEAIEQTNTEEVRSFRLGELSHGFRQRVGIGQALVHRPKVLILDEPINGLDPVQIVEMRDLILSLRGRHTVVLSSHILSEITRTCDRVLIIDQGRLVAEGAEKDLHKQASETMMLSCEVAGKDAVLESKLSAVDGVSQVAVDEIEGGTSAVFNLRATRDVRSEVSKIIVDSGAGLLGMKRDGGGLESIFMGLVKEGRGESRD